MDVATLSEPDTKAFLLGAQSHRSFKLCDDHFVWIGLGGGAGRSERNDLVCNDERAFWREATISDGVLLRVHRS